VHKFEQDFVTRHEVILGVPASF